MLTLGWHWFTSWIIGWGGISSAVAVAAWALWFFCPSILLTYKTQLLHIAVAATVFAFASGYFFTSGFNSGHAVALREVAALNEAAVKRVEEGKGDIANCRAGGGTWDVTDGSCK